MFDEIIEQWQKLYAKFKVCFQCVYSGNYGKLLVPILNSNPLPDMRTLFARKISGKVKKSMLLLNPFIAGIL